MSQNTERLAGQQADAITRARLRAGRLRSAGLAKGSLDEIVAGRVQVVVARESNSTPSETISEKFTLPPEALVTLKDGIQVISQELLSKQRPPNSFVQAGGKIFDQANVYTVDQRDPNTMQCWLKDGVWYWNKKAGDWLAQELGGNIKSQSDLLDIVNQNKGENNKETLQNMQIAPVGWFNAHVDRVCNMGDGILRSCSVFDDGFMQIVWLGADKSDPQCSGMWDSNGLVPFVIMDTTVSA